jgi:hypothetical protein
MLIRPLSDQDFAEIMDVISSCFMNWSWRKQLRDGFVKWPVPQKPGATTPGIEADHIIRLPMKSQRRMRKDRRQGQEQRYVLKANWT